LTAKGGLYLGVGGKWSGSKSVLEFERALRRGGVQGIICRAEAKTYPELLGEGLWFMPGGIFLDFRDF
jgi:hypothetical protein